jgi:polyisoprenoid-binding protein YceI
MMFLSVLLLAACSSETPSPTIEAIQPTQAESMATEAPTATAEPAPTELPLTEAPAADPPSEGAYKIVPGESQLKYEVGEVFINDNNRFNLAEGVTTEVSGEILVDRAAPQNSQIGTITADISQFKSDSSRRDNAIRERFLQSSQYPMVTFVPTQIEGLPDSYTEGQEITLKITGDLTIREVTRPVTFDATARLEGDTLFGTATTTILMSDFGFGPISILGMLNTEDDAKVTLTLVARP